MPRRIPQLLIILLLWPVTSAAQQEKFDLRPRLVGGATHRVRMSMEQSITMEQRVDDVIVQTVKQTLRTSVVYTMKVEAADESGKARLSIRYDSVEFHAQSPDGTVDYDSAHAPAAGPPIASALAALVGQEFRATVADGKVESVEGTEAMLAAVLAKLNLPDGAARAAYEHALRQQLVPESLKASLQNLFAPWPAEPVAAGQRWNRKTHVATPFPLIVESTYQLTGDPRKPLVSVEGDCSTLSDATLQLPQLRVSYNLRGKQFGKIEVDPSTGWTTQADLSQALRGNTTFRTGAEQRAETEALEVESTIHVENVPMESDSSPATQPASRP